MDMQKFVSDVIVKLGGMVIPVEYSLCEVLIPEEYSGIFSGRTEVMLAFDSEVAQENPGSEFVTFGSHTLDGILEIVKRKPISTLRYGVVDRLALSNPEEKIRSVIGGYNRTGIHIANQRPVLGVWPVFTFCIQYLSDEKVEEILSIWFNPVTGEYEPEMEKTYIFFESRPVYTYPVIVPDGFRTALEEACSRVSAYANRQAEARTRGDLLEREILRIGDYYEDIAEENHKRALRKGIGEERLQELKSKSEVLALEKEKQIREMKEKLTVKAEISIEHSMTYFIPMLEYDALIMKKDSEEGWLFYYNPITRSMTGLKK
jgi:hypothetical protein